MHRHQDGLRLATRRFGYREGNSIGVRVQLAVGQGTAMNAHRCRMKTFPDLLVESGGNRLFDFSPLKLTVLIPRPHVQSVLIVLSPQSRIAIKCWPYYPFWR